MKRQLAGGLAATLFAAALVAVLVFSHPLPRPHAAIGTADVASSVVLDTPTPLPTDTPTPVPTQVATVQNPLPPPPPPAAPPPAPAPAPPPPASTPTPSPTPPPDPTPPPASPTPTPPPPPPPPCSWSITVSSLSSPGVWSPLGTWTGSSASATSPIFITASYGWLDYTYQFSASCSGSLTSVDLETGSTTIYTDSINGAASNEHQANLPPSTQVQFKVVLA